MRRFLDQVFEFVYVALFLLVGSWVGFLVLSSLLSPQVQNPNLGSGGVAPNVQLPDTSR